MRSTKYTFSVGIEKLAETGARAVSRPFCYVSGMEFEPSRFLDFRVGAMAGRRIMDEHSITFEEHAKDEDVRRISEGLGKYNLEQTGRDDFRKLNVFVRDNDDEIIGGVIGGTYWGWLYVDLLWIDERVRHLGYGRKLLEAAEAEAIKRGCTQVFLDTFSFQARPFYEKHGYIVFGTLKDFPPGHERYFLQKTLSQN